MNKKTTQRNIKLSLDLDSYISNHPKVLNQVPSGATIVIVSSEDEDRELSESNLKIARNSRSGKFVLARKSGSSWKIESLVPAR